MSRRSISNLVPPLNLGRMRSTAMLNLPTDVLNEHIFPKLAPYTLFLLRLTCRELRSLIPPDAVSFSARFGRRRPLLLQDVTLWAANQGYLGILQWAYQWMLGEPPVSPETLRRNSIGGSSPHLESPCAVPLRRGSYSGYAPPAGSPRTVRRDQRLAQAKLLLQGHVQSASGEQCVAWNATRQGHLHILQWLLELESQQAKASPQPRSSPGSSLSPSYPSLPRSPRTAIFQVDSTICALAAAQGHIHILEWALGRGAAWGATCLQAAAGGQLEVLKWARARGAPWSAAVCTK
jgi:hypothetical protein